MLLKYADHLKPSRILSRPHIGKIVDNNDPKKLRRVRCEIKGIFEGDKTLFPWVIPLNGSSTNVDIPKVGTEVRIEFKYQDIYHPFYGGGIHTEVNTDPYFDADYPESFGFKKSNISMKFNDTSKEGEIIHAGGFKLKLKPDGTVELNLQDFIQLIKGKVDITADGKVTISGKGGIDCISDGNGKFSGKGGTDVGDSSSATNIDGSAVNLAGGGVGVAFLGAEVLCQAGNMGAPVMGKVMEGSSKVTTSK